MMIPDDNGILLPLAISLAQGFLIGLERGWQEREAEKGTRVAGVRTYGLIGLLGGFSGLLALEAGQSVIGFAFLGLTATLVAGYAVNAPRSNYVGITSLIAGLLTFFFGAAATQGFIMESAAAAAVTAFVLGYKAELHRWVNMFKAEELHATLKLVLISLVVLPILPNQEYGPWQAINPFEVWWMVVLIAGISFAGYFTMKIVGTGKGALITGFLAGLASSTALTYHFSRLVRSRPESADALASGILLACGTMFPRMLAVGTIIHPKIFYALFFPALAMMMVLFGAAAVFRKRLQNGTADEASAPLKNPLELGPAIGFGVFLAFIMLAAKGLTAVFGEAGVMFLAAVSGIADVDSITLALAKMSRLDLDIELSAFALIVAGAVNSVVKGGITWLIAGKDFGLRTTVPLLVAACVGLLVAWVSLPYGAIIQG